MKKHPKSAASAGEPVARKRKPRRRLPSIVLSAVLDLSPMVAIASILISLLSLFMPLAIMQVYDRMIPRQSIESLVLLVGLIVVAAVVEAVFRIARNHVVSWAATKLAWRSQREVLKRFMAAPVGTIESESASRNLDRLQALMTLLWSALLLGEQVNAITVTAALVVVGCVAWGQRSRSPMVNAPEE